jgi:hypothetical protein
MKDSKELYIVYCIDTEGPLHEPLQATFDRINQLFGITLEPSKENLRKLQRLELDVKNKEAIAKVFDPHLLAYNDTWDKVDEMLDRIMTKQYREKFLDSNGRGLVYNWHCIDHVGFSSNKRRRDIGFGNIFNHYQEKINEHGGIDNIHWHFHPIAFGKQAHMAATSYSNSTDILHEIITRRVIDNNWFPTVNRAGFHTVRRDSSMFMEEWIPFDYSNQAQYNYKDSIQKDVVDGRFGDWRRAPKSWKPYHPSYRDYQSPGTMNRYSTKCLNIGTRLRLLTEHEIRKAFELARDEGKAILSFTNHDFRDMSIDIEDTYEKIFRVAKEFDDVNVLNSDAIEAMQKYCYSDDNIVLNKLKLSCEVQTQDNVTKLVVNQENGSVFGTQPYLAIKTKDGRYYHDNFDELGFGKSWVYTFDWYTLLLEQIESLKVAANDKYGNSVVYSVELRS